MGMGKKLLYSGGENTHSSPTAEECAVKTVIKKIK